MPCNVLVASWGGPGHLGPTLTAARQLRAHGHGVRFIARADAREPVEAAGFGFATWQRQPRFSPIARSSAPLENAYDDLLFGPAAARGADTLDEIKRAPTDAVLTDSGLFGSVLAAEAARVPCALLSPTISLRPLPGIPPIGSGLGPPRTPAERVRVEAANNRFVAVMNNWLPMLNEARSRLRIAPCNHVLELFDRPARLLIAMSAAFDFPADFLPRNVRYIGPCWIPRIGPGRGFFPGLRDPTVRAHWFLSAQQIRTRPMHCNALSMQLDASGWTRLPRSGPRWKSTACTRLRT
jgi:UDP:flavonoid glycosyltransferase YjiC (YdhE family)